MAAKKKARAKRGEVGPEIFAQIEKMVAAERSDAPKRSVASHRSRDVSPERWRQITIASRDAKARSSRRGAGDRRGRGGSALGLCSAPRQRWTKSRRHSQARGQITQLRRENQRVALFAGS
jgi:hypothetical protein